MKISLRAMGGMIIVVLAIGQIACAQELLSRPLGYVSDFAQVLTAQEQTRITSLAASLDQKTGAQLAVVTVKSTSPSTVEDYAVRLFEHWGIGQKGKDNGILILVAIEDRAVRIEVGYGLEGVVTDALSKTVIERFMVSQFREQLYGQGILAGSAAVISLVAKSYGVTVTGEEEGVYQAVRQDEMPAGLRLIIAFLIVFFFFVNGSGLWPLLLFGSTGRRGYWSGGGYHGGFGGGFGGFGGGMSGGGGASGRW